MKTAKKSFAPPLSPDCADILFSDERENIHNVSMSEGGMNIGVSLDQLNWSVKTKMLWIFQIEVGGFSGTEIFSRLDIPYLTQAWSYKNTDNDYKECPLYTVCPRSLDPFYIVN